MMDSTKLGLKENWQQFALLVLVNAFVGGMIGQERSILPAIAEKEFHLVANTAILSFIIAFGFVKAITNYFTGTLSDKFGRKKLLVIGWLIGLPVPFLLMYAPTWEWIIIANVFLGINQGLTWSTTVIMKMDLVGEKNRGLAMGLNEFAGYLSVAIIALLTGWIASEYGLRPYPFYVGVVIVLMGLTLSIFFVKDTYKHVQLESEGSNKPRLKNTFFDTSFLNRNLSSVTQAGFVNNLNDGMAWGLFPLFLASRKLSLDEISIVIATYPAVWGIAQLFTGKLADHISRKLLLFAGMFIQGVALLCFAFASELYQFVFLSVTLGIGTATVYPTFLASIADFTHPSDRSKSMGTFRFWRDSGYAFGAILTGFFADYYNVSLSIMLVGIITILSAFFTLRIQQSNFYK